MTEKVVIGNATLYHGDCREVLPTLGRFDAVITDPPYGINANKQTLGSGKKTFHRGEAWDSEPPDLLGCRKAAELVCFWGGNYFSDQLPVTNHWLVWHKRNDGLSFSECELAWTNFGRQVRHLSHNWSGEEKEHPTQKPLAVMLWTLQQAGSVQTILDPFMGSGTTGVACVQLGRAFTGIERERKYFDIACERISRAQAQGQMFTPEQPVPEQLEIGA